MRGFDKTKCPSGTKLLAEASREAGVTEIDVNLYSFMIEVLKSKWDAKS